MKNLNKRILNMPESIFATMSRLAFLHDAVNLGQGFPDFDGPEWIKEAAYRAMKEGKNQYAPMPGIHSLRSKIAEIYADLYGIEWNPETSITITAGATEALYAVFTALLEENDEVILFEPFYDSYQADITLAGAVPRCVTLRKPDGDNSTFHFSGDELRSAINEKTKMIVLNNPHNPTGKVFTETELQEIASAAIENDLYVLSDEVYEFLTFDNVKHIPIATLPNMRDRTITISSAGKTFGMTGWKVGWLCAEEKLTQAVRTVHQWTTFAVNTPAQHAVAYAFGKLDIYLPSFRAAYQRKRNLLAMELQKTIFRAHPVHGTYFMMIDIPEGYSRNSMEFAVQLAEEYKTATIPPSVFYLNSSEGDGMLRLCFAKEEETILLAGANLRKLR